VPRQRYRYGFHRLPQFYQDTYALDPERAAVLAAALEVLAVNPRNALGAFRTWVEDVGWDEWLVDLAGWGVLGYQIEETQTERLVVLRWVDWD
jgi:hypothetical protein